jgi:lipopolysaccharide assembly protein A
MRLIVWLLRGIVFVLLFGLAVKNSAPVELRFFLDGVWQAPLSLIILAAFVAGTFVGLTVTLVRSAAERRQLRALRRQVADGGEGRHS